MRIKLKGFFSWPCYYHYLSLLIVFCFLFVISAMWIKPIKQQTQRVQNQLSTAVNRPTTTPLSKQQQLQQKKQFYHSENATTALNNIAQLAELAQLQINTIQSRPFKTNRKIASLNIVFDAQGNFKQCIHFINLLLQTKPLIFFSELRLYSKHHLVHVNAVLSSVVIKG